MASERLGPFYPVCFNRVSWFLQHKGLTFCIWVIRISGWMTSRYNYQRTVSWLNGLFNCKDFIEGENNGKNRGKLSHWYPFSLNCLCQELTCFIKIEHCFWRVNIFHNRFGGRELHKYAIKLSCPHCRDVLDAQLSQLLQLLMLP